jgi:hypothetical protein
LIREDKKSAVIRDECRRAWQTATPAAGPTALAESARIRADVCAGVFDGVGKSANAGPQRARRAGGYEGFSGEAGRSGGGSVRPTFASMSARKARARAA